MKTKSRVPDGKLGITAVDGIAGEACAIAKIFAIGSTINAFAVRPAQPWNTDAVTGRKSFDALTDLFDASNDLMPGDERQFGIRQLTIDNVKVGAANGTSGDTNEQLSRAYPGRRHFLELKRLPWFFQNHRAHVDLITMPVQKSEIRNKFEARKLDPPQANRNLTRSLAF